MDLVFVAIHIGLRVQADDMPSMLNIESESSLPSLYLHVKWLAMAILLFVTARRARDRAALFLGIFSLILFLDDAAQIHETLGDTIAAALQIPPMMGADPDDIGELFAAAGLGVICLACLTAAWRRPGVVTRPHVVSFTLMIVALACVGVGLDLVHAALSETRALVFGTLEDAGELMVGSAMLSLAAVIRDRAKTSPAVG